MYEYQVGPEAGIGLLPILFFVGVYVFFTFCQFKMAQKLGYSSEAWWSFIPILNTFLLFKMAGKPAWWFLLCLVPLINIVVFAILWIEVAKGLQQSPVWGFLVLVPLLNFIAVGVLAFAGKPHRLTPPPPSHERPRQPQGVA